MESKITKEEILKAEYEKVFSSQKYENSVNKGMNQLYILPAMERYAAQFKAEQCAGVWVKASERLPEDLNETQWRKTLPSQPSSIQYKPKSTEMESIAFGDDEFIPISELEWSDNQSQQSQPQQSSLSDEEVSKMDKHEETDLLKCEIQGYKQVIKELKAALTNRQEGWSDIADEFAKAIEQTFKQYEMPDFDRQADEYEVSFLYPGDNRAYQMLRKALTNYKTQKGE